jgi:hypothetical protein
MKIELNRNEALVLTDFLLRFTDKDVLSIEHEGEEQLLYDLLAKLESKVPELVDSDYKNLLNIARRSILEDE